MSALIYVLIQNQVAEQLGTTAGIGLYAPVFAVFILLLASDRTIVSRLLDRLEFLGEISFSFYLLQLPVYKLLSLVSGEMPLRQDLFYVYLGVLFYLSVLTCRFVEEPLRQVIRGKRNLVQKISPEQKTLKTV